MAAQQAFSDYKHYLVQQLAAKLYENNTWKSFSINGHTRDLNIPGIHRFVFEEFSKETGQEKEDRLTFNNIKSITDSLIGVDLTRFHKNGDISIVAPWGIPLVDVIKFTDDKIYNNQRNSYVMCLEDGLGINNNNNIRVFLPCGGPDPETDEIPEWVENVRVDQLCNINVDRLPVQKSNGVCSKIKKGDEYFTCLKDQVEEGDYVMFNGERVRARAVSVDFMSDYRNCIGINHRSGGFKRDHKPQAFKILKMPNVQGKIFTLEAKDIKYTRPVKLSFSSKGKQNIGNVNITYNSFCSNSLGFLIHDTAVSQD